MRIREWGKVCDQVWRLGDAECCVYLIQGRKTTLMLNGCVFRPIVTVHSGGV